VFWLIYLVLEITEALQLLFEDNALLEIQLLFWLIFLFAYRFCCRGLLGFASFLLCFSLVGLKVAFCEEIDIVNFFLDFYFTEHVVRKLQVQT